MKSFRDYLGLSNSCSYDFDDVIGRADRFGFQNFCSPDLSTNKTLIKKQCKKWLSSKRCHFVKVSGCFSKSCEQVEFPLYALRMHHFKNYKGQ